MKTYFLLSLKEEDFEIRISSLIKKKNGDYRCLWNKPVHYLVLSRDTKGFFSIWGVGIPMKISVEELKKRMKEENNKKLDIDLIINNNSSLESKILPIRDWSELESFLFNFLENKEIEMGDKKVKFKKVKKKFKIYELCLN